MWVFPVYLHNRKIARHPATRPPPFLRVWAICSCGARRDRRESDAPSEYRDCFGPGAPWSRIHGAPSSSGLRSRPLTVRMIMPPSHPPTWPGEARPAVTAHRTPVRPLRKDKPVRPWLVLSHFAHRSHDADVRFTLMRRLLLRHCRRPGYVPIGRGLG